MESSAEVLRLMAVVGELWIAVAGATQKGPPFLPSHLVASVRPGGDRTRLPVGLSLFALAVGTFGIGTTEFVIMGLLPQVAAGLGVTVTEAGHLISASALGVVIGAPLLAGASVTFPRRTVLIALMGTFAIGNLLSALAPD